MKQAFPNIEHFKQSASFRGDKAAQKYPKILTAWLNKLCHFHYHPKEVLGSCPRHKQSSTNILTPHVGTWSEAMQPSAGHPRCAQGDFAPPGCPPDVQEQREQVRQREGSTSHIPETPLQTFASHLYHCRSIGHWFLQAKCLLGVTESWNKLSWKEPLKVICSSCPAMSTDRCGCCALTVRHRCT